MPDLARSVKAAEDWMAEQRVVWEHRLDQLDGYLEDLGPTSTKEGVK